MIGPTAHGTTRCCGRVCGTRGVDRDVIEAAEAPNPICRGGAVIIDTTGASPWPARERGQSP